MVKRTIVCIGTNDDRIFTVGEADHGRIINTIELQANSIPKVWTDPLSYVIEMEDERNVTYAVVPLKSVTYLEYVKRETKKEDKPLELHAAAQAGEMNEQA